MEKLIIKITPILIWACFVLICSFFVFEASLQTRVMLVGDYYNRSAKVLKEADAKLKNSNKLIKRCNEITKVIDYEAIENEFEEEN